MLLSQPLVATLFQHKQFTAFDTRMAAMSVFGLSFGLPAFALVKILLPAFYARQDTRTPVRAGVASLVSNMVLNVLFLAVLYLLWVPASEQGNLMRGLASTPGLHLAIGLASALASYINLMLLWHWLRKAGVYQRQPGWARHLTRLGLACAAMAVALLLALYWIPDFTAIGKWQRVGYLAVLVGGGGVV
jgi:putative peptidoglycan lipid II flippase